MIFTDEHDLFRASVRGMLARVVEPHLDEWEAAGIMPLHELFTAFAEAGVLGLEYEPEFGGQGADHSFTVVWCEELGRMGTAIGMATGVQTDMATPSLARFGSRELKVQYLAPALAGRAVAAIAVTEPDAGSDVAGLRTRAVRDGDEWVISGSKIYITNGTQADWLCLLARTSDAGGYRGLSQIIVPTSTPGVTVARKLDKLGNRASDTAELVFEDVRVPVSNTIGTVDRGFQQQMVQFQNERMSACYAAVGSMELAIERTVSYLRERMVFGVPLLSNQYIQFRLAELVAEIDMLRQYNYACATAYSQGQDTTRSVTIAKLKAGRLKREVADCCLQFHGGVGYMEDTWTAQYFRDSRLLSIGGGADEIMLRLLAKLEGFETAVQPS